MTNKTITYAINWNYIIDIPEDISYLISEIEESKYIYDLYYYLDDEENYRKRYWKSTWNKAIKFLLKHAITIHNEYNVKIDVPKIYNWPRWSIDLLWENYITKERLIINIPEKWNIAQFAKVYDDYKKNKRWDLDIYDYIITEELIAKL